MPLNIYQTEPRLVFLCGKIVYKFFHSIEECKNEVKCLKQSPLDSEFDHITGFTMKFVDIIKIHDDHYSMKVINGKPLNNVSSLKDYKLAGSWLRYFHNITLDDKKAFLFGDYTLGHIFINNEKKEITTMDPGAGFGAFNYVEFDIARFIVDLMQSNNCNIFQLRKKIESFLDGYKNPLDYERLISTLLFRINMNLKKRLHLNQGFRKYSSYFRYAISKLKYFYIRTKLGDLNSNDN